MEQDLAPFIAIVRDLGTAGGPIFFILWWLERADRKALQKRLDDKADEEKQDHDNLLRETVTAINASAGGLKEMAVGVQEIRSSIGTIAEIVRNLMAKATK